MKKVYKKEPKNLILKGGCFAMRLDLFKDHRNKKAVRLTCGEIESDFEEQPQQGYFYLNKDSIDKLIEKLKEAKTYIDA